MVEVTVDDGSGDLEMLLLDSQTWGPRKMDMNGTNLLVRRLGRPHLRH